MHLPWAAKFVPCFNVNWGRALWISQCDNYSPTSCRHGVLHFSSPIAERVLFSQVNNFYYTYAYHIRTCTLNIAAYFVWEWQCSTCILCTCVCVMCLSTVTEYERMHVYFPRDCLSIKVCVVCSLQLRRVVVHVDSCTQNACMFVCVWLHQLILNFLQRSKLFIFFINFQCSLVEYRSRNHSTLVQQDDAALTTPLSVLCHFKDFLAFL